MSFNPYAFPGWLYDAFYLGLTMRLEEKHVKLPGLRQLALQPGQVVLDWGCGTGLMLRGIAEALEHGKIIALDRSVRLLRRAKQSRWPDYPGECWFVAGDGCCMPVSSVDAVVASYSLGVTSPEQCRRAVREIHAVLGSGGKLLIIDMYWPEAGPWLKKAYYAVHAFLARALFRQCFTGTALDEARQCFEELTYTEYPALLAFTWVGKKA